MTQRCRSRTQLPCFWIHPSGADRAGHRGRARCRPALQAVQPAEVLPPHHQVILSPVNDLVFIYSGSTDERCDLCAAPSSGPAWPHCSWLLRRCTSSARRCSSTAWAFTQADSWTRWTYSHYYSSFICLLKTSQMKSFCQKPQYLCNDQQPWMQPGQSSSVWWRTSPLINHRIASSPSHKLKFLLCLRIQKTLLVLGR